MVYMQVRQNFQLRAYSFGLHLKIVYYYFSVLNFLSIIQIPDVLVMTNNVIARSEYQFLLPHATGSSSLNHCWKMMSTVLKILLHCFSLWFTQ